MGRHDRARAPPIGTENTHQNLTPHAGQPLLHSFPDSSGRRFWTSSAERYHGEAGAGSGVPDSVSSSADTPAASAAPIRCKIASA
jgi:hypothetical protein